MDNIKLVCFDLNKTLIEDNSWQKLNLASGMTIEEDQVLLTLWEEGIISYKEWQKILANLYKKRGNLTRNLVEKTIHNNTYKPFVKETINYLKEKGYKLALLTGSIDSLAKLIADDLGFDYYKAANILIYDENNKINDIVVLGEESEFKLYQLNAICFELGIDLTECACVGDGSNEKIIFEKTKHGITFSGSKLESSAWKVINDLGELKSIL